MPNGRTRRNTICTPPSKKETDPKKKLALINAWKEKYPETEYKLAAAAALPERVSAAQRYSQSARDPQRNVDHEPKGPDGDESHHVLHDGEQRRQPGVPGQRAEGGQYGAGQSGQQAGHHQRRAVAASQEADRIAGAQDAGLGGDAAQERRRGAAGVRQEPADRPQPGRGGLLAGQHAARREDAGEDFPGAVLLRSRGHL